MTSCSKWAHRTLVLKCFVLHSFANCYFNSDRAVANDSCYVLFWVSTSPDVAHKTLSPYGTTCNHVPSEPSTTILPLCRHGTLQCTCSSQPACTHLHSIAVTF